MTQGYAISTRLVNHANGQTYEWEQKLLPTDNLEKPDGVPFMWDFAEEEGAAYRATHTFRCVIHPENWRGNKQGVLYKTPHVNIATWGIDSCNN